ncbi:MAG: YceI family protein [Phycisphaerales bacterium]|nr:YceI family protein [Phycisphaerales bacterium]
MRFGLGLGRAAVAAVVLCGVGLAVGLAPRAEKPAAALPAAEGEWKIDSVHSSIIFRILHQNAAYFYGRFNDLGGTVSWDDANPSAASFNVEIKTGSVDSKNAARDKHLRSASFFNTEQFPTATFTSTSVKPAGENTVEVTGDFTLNGVTKPVTAKVEKTGQGKGQRGEVIGFETVFTLRRSDFGITFMPGGLGDDVKIFASFEAGRP